MSAEVIAVPASLAVQKCMRLLSRIVELARQHPANKVRVTRKMIAELLVGNIDVDIFLDQFPAEFEYYPSSTLASFLKASIPLVRQHLQRITELTRTHDDCTMSRKDTSPSPIDHVTKPEILGLNKAIQRKNGGCPPARSEKHCREVVEARKFGLVLRKGRRCLKTTMAFEQRNLDEDPILTENLKNYQPKARKSPAGRPPQNVELVQSIPAYRCPYCNYTIIKMANTRRRFHMHKLRCGKPKACIHTTSGPSAPRKARKEQKRKSSNGTQFFKGLHFFLTARGHNDKHEPAIMYDKMVLQDLIESHGGVVLQSVGLEKCRGETFLVTDKYARTLKYLYAVAAGIPCVSYLWILSCSKNLTPWTSYRIDAGFSWELHKDIPPHTKQPLKNLNIRLLAGSPEFLDNWIPVLQAAGANVCKYETVESAQKDKAVVVTDLNSGDIPLALLVSNIPLVTAEWLVQSIVVGEQRRHDAIDFYLIPEDNADLSM